jgi:hypothetical protein
MVFRFIIPLWKSLLDGRKLAMIRSAAIIPATSMPVSPALREPAAKLALPTRPRAAQPDGHRNEAVVCGAEGIAVFDELRRRRAVRDGSLTSSSAMGSISGRFRSYRKARLAWVLAGAG